MSVFLSQNSTLANAGHTGVVDPRKGGQQGLKRDSDFWYHNSLYVRQPLIAVMMAVPRAFRYLPDGDALSGMLKSLVELHAISITGLNQTYTNEFDEKVIGASGQVMQTHTRTGRERSAPVFSWAELDGKPVTRLLKYWNDYLLSDPESGVPALAGVDAYIADGSPHLTPEDKAMSVLFIEPTHNRLDVNYVELCSNMMPTTVPDEMSFTKGEAGEQPQLDIEFTCISMAANAGLNRLAKAYLDSLNKSAYLPDSIANTLDAIDPLVADEKQPSGYRVGVESAAAALTE